MTGQTLDVTHCKGIPVGRTPWLELGSKADSTIDVLNCQIASDSTCSGKGLWGPSMGMLI